MPGPRAGVVELQAPLATVLGLSQLPGELDGWGPVVADIARQVTTQMRDAQWRFSVYDRRNELAYHGITHARPIEPSGTSSGTSSGMSTSEVDSSRQPSDPEGNRDDNGTVDHSANGRHRTNRRPTAKQAAFVKARDRACVAPGCRRPARRCDIDHTLDWVHGGETEHCNLGLLCRLHHLFKHAIGCELVQLSPGTFVWNTPARMQYKTTADPPLIDDTQIADLFGPPSTELDEEPGWLGADPNLLSIDDVVDSGEPYPELVPCLASPASV